MTDAPVAGYLVGVIFILFLATSAAGALIAVFARRIIRSVCGLGMCALGLAGLFYLLNSPFLALMKILIYIGAVGITLIFAIMLAEPDEPTVGAGERRGWWTAGALIVCGAIFWSLARISLGRDWAAPVERVAEGSIEEIGIALLSTYSLAFEGISLALLIAIIGALAIGRAGRHRS
jgi:NADH:ubiquinone oxidoreductase subunit 6 (subunit J)